MKEHEKQTSTEVPVSKIKLQIVYKVIINIVPNGGSGQHALSRGSTPFHKLH